MRMRVYFWNSILGKYSQDAIFDTLQEAHDYAARKMQEFRNVPHAKIMQWDSKGNLGACIEIVNRGG